jgi:hypothetical protein
MKTNELKKGMIVLLHNGWYAEVMDNLKGNIRMCKVYGYETEIGSVYSHDIVGRCDSLDGRIEDLIEYTPAQLKLIKEVNILWGDA